MGTDAGLSLGAGWWRDGDGLTRYVADLAAGELQRQRFGQAQLPPLPWSANLVLGAGGLGADSLELVGMATALAEAIHLHRSGTEDRLLARRTLSGWVEIARAGLERYSDTLTFRTSGSSGAPKACAHALADLADEVEFFATLVPGRRRVVTFVPCHHIYGFLFTVLLPHRLGLPVADARDRLPMSVAAGLEAGDLVVAHPLAWTGMAAGPSLTAGNVVGVNAGGPLAAEIGDALAARGLARLLDVYGASETAGIGWRDDLRGPYALLPYWVRDAQVLRRPNVPGTAGAPDCLDWIDERRFLLAGRHDGMVQVAGVNVSPAYVRDVLREHPGVADAAVRLMRPDEGVRLKAFIVPREPAGAEALEPVLLRWIEERLEAAERPRSLTFGPALPQGLSGKPSDWIA